MKATDRKAARVTGESSFRLSLDRMATYEIKVPGRVELDLTGWVDDLTISFDENPVATVLTGIFDQAGLHGLLRKVHLLGLPLLSVLCLDWPE